jgi:hypothetical protein
MKTIILLLFTAVCFSQTYNDQLKRYEYRDAYGTLTGYKTYDPYQRVWVYIKVEPTNNRYAKLDYGHAIDASAIDLQGQVATIKQARYDANQQKVQDAVNTCRDYLRNVQNNNSIRTKMLQRFKAECLDVLNQYKGNYDMSKTADTNYLVNWLTNTTDKIVAEEVK